jgi:hypothetical protein
VDRYWPLRLTQKYRTNWQIALAACVTLPRSERMPPMFPLT